MNLRVGQKIRMELTWPGSLDDGTNVNLWVGIVVRSARVEVEVGITADEFRSRRRPLRFGEDTPDQSAHDPPAPRSEARGKRESFSASLSLPSAPSASSLGQPLMNLHCWFGACLSRRDTDPRPAQFRQSEGCLGAITVGLEETPLASCT